jgi:hypothetical protein
MAADLDVVKTVEHVFAIRATHDVPHVPHDPPPGWSVIYPGLAEGLTETAPRLDAALDVVRGFWAEAIKNAQAPPK